VFLFAEGGALVASGAALVGTEQPCVLIPQSGQTIGMIDAELGWHLMLTTVGTESQRTIRINPAVDLPDEIHPIYGGDDLAVVRATAGIDGAAHYIDDLTVSCPLGLGAGLGDVVSVPMDGVAAVGQAESVTWTGTPNGATESAVIRRHVAIAPSPHVDPVPITPPTVEDDEDETDAITAVSGNVLTNDDAGLVIVAVNGLTANVGVAVAGSNGGVFVISSTGAWSFDPDGDFPLLTEAETAETSVVYHASDGIAESTAVLVITVTSSGQAPLWTAQEVQTDLYLDVFDFNTVGLDGAALIQCSDKSGNARHASQALVERRPTYQPTGFNGLPTIALDGINDQLDLVPFAQVSGQNIYAVLDTTNLGPNWRVFLDRTSGSASNLALLLGADGGTRDRMPNVYWNGGARAVSPAVQRRAIFRWSFALGAWALTQIDSDAPVVQTFTASALTNWASICNALAQQSLIKLSELIITPPESGTSSLALIQGSLAHKWGMSSNLVEGHPYKEEAPRIQAVRDPHWSKVSFLSYCGQASGVKPVRDLTGKVVTCHTDVALSNAQTMFGNTLRFPGTCPSYIAIPRDSDFDFGSGDFTIEMFLYLNSAPASLFSLVSLCFAISPWYSLRFRVLSNLRLYGLVSFNGSAVHTFEASASIPVQEWRHVAIERKNGTFYLVMHGQVVATLAGLSGSLYHSTRDPVQVGADFSSSNITCDRPYLNGYIAQLRVTKGVARYAGTYEVPLAALPFM
jgi:VCBS repeat-containing protein